MRFTRRRFLAGSVLAALWGAAPRLALAAPASTPWRNWSGYLRANPAGRLAPATEDELVALLGTTAGPIRPVGAGHSFNPLVPTDGHLLILDNMSGLIDHDPGALTAELWAGTRLSDAGPLLDRVGQAMPNLPDIDRQTLAGAVATSTHGTGKGLASLSGNVTSLRLITPGGDVLDLDAGRQPEIFQAARVSLGALGIVTRIGFQNRTPFRLHSRNWVQDTESVLEDFDASADEWQHFEMMPLLHSDYSLVIAHKETTDPLDPADPAEDDDGGLLSLIDSTPVLLRGSLVNFLAGQIDPTESVDKSYNGLTHLRFDRFNEMEYSVPVDAGPACLREILQTVKREAVDVTIPLEYRLIGADDSWLSMFSGGPRVSISVHRMAQYDHRPYFKLIEPIFWRYGGRPHWGKVHTLGYAELKSLYPRFDDFIEVQRTLDPAGRMLNSHLRRLFGA
jgi:FAD-linked oxidoreductase